MRQQETKFFVFDVFSVFRSGGRSKGPHSSYISSSLICRLTLEKNLGFGSRAKSTYTIVGSSRVRFSGNIGHY